MSDDFIKPDPLSGDEAKGDEAEGDESEGDESEGDESAERGGSPYSRKKKQVHVARDSTEKKIKKDKKKKKRALCAASWKQKIETQTGQSVRPACQKKTGCKKNGRSLTQLENRL